MIVFVCVSVVIRGRLGLYFEPTLSLYELSTEWTFGRELCDTRHTEETCPYRRSQVGEQL
jgi:hypothetical protein